MRNSRTSADLTDVSVLEISAECRALLEKYGFSGDEIDVYLKRVLSVFGCYRQQLSQSTTFEYRIYKRYGRVELWLILKGKRIDPREEEREQGDIAQFIQQLLNPLVWNQTVVTSHIYVAGYNIVTVASPRIRAKKPHQSPMLYSSLLGLVCGLICLQLPEGIRSVIVEDFARPVQSVTLGLITGVMAPVILFSMITAISALGSINDLTDLGFRIIGRFVGVALSVMSVGIAVSLLFYNVISTGTSDFRIRQVSELFLGIIPTNVLSPLLEGNIPQLVVLSTALGAALLILGDKVADLKTILRQMHEWVMTLMGMVMSVVPFIPFICIFTTVARGAGANLLNGWEFIVALYVSVTICGVIKLTRVCLKYKVSPRVVLRKLKPMIETSFGAANTSAMIKQEYEISERELGIKPEFSSFWIPMSQAMLNPRSTLMLVIPPFLILKDMGAPITMSFLLLLITMVLELSLANPGTTGGWTILFASLAFPGDYVGMYMTYKLACANYEAAYGAMQAGLEQIEAAHGFNAIDLEKLRS